MISRGSTRSLRLRLAAETALLITPSWCRRACMAAAIEMLSTKANVSVKKLAANSAAPASLRFLTRSGR